MEKNRLEAFSDGVLAIILTIMVLELKTPHGAALADLKPIIPDLLSYVLSFVYVGIYWSNHHHMLHTTKHVNGRVLLANLHLLFWLSLVPFVTSWMGENHFADTPTALYGVILLMAAISYAILQQAILSSQPKDSLLAKAVGKTYKEKLSIALYVTAIAFAYVFDHVSQILYAIVALMWVIPDRRIEKLLAR